MRCTKFLLALHLLFCPDAQLWAQPAPALFGQRCFGGNGVDQGSVVIQTADGQLLCLAYTSSTNGDVGPSLGNGDAWVVRSTTTGTILGQWRLGGGDSDGGRGMVVLPDGGWVLAGYSHSTDGIVGQNLGDSDGWVVRCNADGEVLWSVICGGSGYDSMDGIKATPDGGFIAVGITASEDGDITTPMGELDVLVMKLDAAGQQEWVKTYGGSLDDFSFDMLATEDGGALVGGSSYSADGHLTTNDGEADAWLLKLDATGAVQWQRSYGGITNDGIRSMAPAPDGGAACVGFTKAGGGDVTGYHGGPTDAWAIVVDAAGTLVAQRCLGGSETDDGKNIVAVPTGGYAVAAITDSNNGDVGQVNGSFDYWLVRLNEELEPVWETTFGGPGYDSPTGLAWLADGSFALFGSATGNGGDVSGNHGGMYDAWLVLTEPEAVYIPERTHTNQLQLTYDWAGAAVLLQAEGVLHGVGTVEVLASSGARVVHQVVGLALSEVPIRVDVSGLAPGHYVVVLTSPNGRRTGRFVRW